MSNKELIKRLEVSCLGLDAVDPLRLLVDDVVSALRQTEQEPVAWIDMTKFPPIRFKELSLRCDLEPFDGYALCFAPPAQPAQPQRTWVGLTGEEIHNLDPLPHQMFDTQRIKFAKAIEAKLKQKNGYAEEKNFD